MLTESMMNIFVGAIVGAIGTYIGAVCIYRRQNRDIVIQRFRNIINEAFTLADNTGNDRIEPNDWGYFKREIFRHSVAFNEFLFIIPVSRRSKYKIKWDEYRTKINTEKKSGNDMPWNEYRDILKEIIKFADDEEYFNKYSIQNFKKWYKEI